MYDIAIVIGGYVNGYSMIQELTEMGVPEVGLLYYDKQPARFSNRLSVRRKIDKTTGQLYIALKEIKIQYGKLVVFPCDEHQLEQLYELKEKIESFCFLPFNTDNLLNCFDKEHQYKICHTIDIPYPRTKTIDKSFDIKSFGSLMFPIIIKPKRRYEVEGLFRIKRIEHDQQAIDFYENGIQPLLSEGCEFLVSELIPGDTNDGIIYAYTCYRSPASKKILNGWVGRKESQYPDDYGIFATASSQENDTIKNQGIKLVEALDACGIVEPEFKFDIRDNQYKLMEVNFRSMMWHRTGSLAGVKLQYTQWLDASGLEVPSFEQKKDKEVCFSYLIHEVYNLLARPMYLKHFRKNVLHNKSSFALWSVKDPLPFLFDLMTLAKIIPKALIKRLKSA